MFSMLLSLLLYCPLSILPIHNMLVRKREREEGGKSGKKSGRKGGGWEGGKKKKKEKEKQEKKEPLLVIMVGPSNSRDVETWGK